MSAFHKLALAPLLVCLASCAAARPSQTTSSAAPGVAKSKSTMIYVTGSRLGIPVSSSGVRVQGAQPTQSIGRQDITLSGQTNPADALNMLVPATTVSANSGSAGR
jgi:hypothetical protein